MKLAALLLLLPLTVAAECVLQDRTVARSDLKIAERSRINQTVVPGPNHNQRCIVDFRARVGTQWYMASGEYDWPGDRPANEACAVAVARADDAVLRQAAPTHIQSEKVLVCNDRPNQQLIANSMPGTVAQLHQFRTHPDFPRNFWHNGAQCRWFLESAFRNNNIHTFQGIICQLQDSNWVVVDKF
jgi:hypothetical protein